MDVLADPSCLVAIRTPHPTAAHIDAVSTGECEHSSILRLCGSIDAALPPSIPPASPPLPSANSLQRTIQTLPSLTPSNYPHANGDPNLYGHDSPTSHPLTPVNPWVAPGDPYQTAQPLALPLSLPLALPIALPSATMMDPGTIPALPEECLLQSSRTCLGCFIETRGVGASDPSHLPIHDVTHDTGSDPETSELDVRLSEVVQEDFGDTCPISDISIQCLSHDEETVSHYGDQLISDQLLSFPLPKHPTGGVKREDEGEKKSPEDSDDAEDESSAKNLYEGLLLDKVSGEEVLLANAGQDWGYFESFISESKMELLDLCSKNELSVNLFSEEDVDNLFDDEDDDSTLSSDVCSLKIRYESFQDNMREKTNVLQEETQFNFFPSVFCAKKEEGVGGEGMLRRGGSAEDLQSKAEEHGLGQEDSKYKREGSDESPLTGSQVSTMSSPKINYLMDFSNTEDSGDYSDDSSYTGSSSDTPQDAKQKKDHQHLCGPKNPLNYGLRSKRKVRYSDDYLYDVDSIESERNSEKKEKILIGQKEEEDVDWCPKKPRKSSRKDSPVVIKYIIINRFKGEKYMSVKLGKLDPADATVSLSTEAVVKYQTLAPLKDFWQERWKEREEQLRLAARDKEHHGIHLNSRRHRPFGSSHPKRKYKIANRLRVQRIHVLEQSSSALGLSVSDVGVTVKEDVRQSVLGGTTTAGTGTLNPSTIMSPFAMTKSRSQEREERESKRLGGEHKTLKIRKFKSEARLRSKIIKEGMEREGEGLESVANEADMCLATVVIEDPAASAGVLGEMDLCSATLQRHFSENHTDTAEEKFPFIPNSCSPDKPSSEESVDRVPVIPGGYLQTLLDATDSSVGAGISYFSQQQPTRQHFPLGLSLEEKQFASSLQLAQSCVLSPPSESELQQSPQNCPSFPPIWNPQLCTSQGFSSDTQDTLLPGCFPSGLSLNNSLTVTGYSQLGTEPNKLLYEKNYLSEPSVLPRTTDLLVCQQASEGQQGLQYQRGTLCTDNGRLISYDSVGSLSAASSSNYSSLSIKSCEREAGEEDVRDGFLSHCSPKVLIQQSVDGLTPLRESSDLLDISNFTPDKFRHSSLSELSPPETPNLSPQVVGREIKIVDKAEKYQDVGELSMENRREGKWNCEAMQQQLEQHSVRGYSVEGDQYQLHSFRGEDELGLVKKDVNTEDFDKQKEECGVKSTRLKRKGSYKQTTDGPKKGRGPRTTKAEKMKAPRQNSRSTKKIKAMLEGKAIKSQASLSDTKDWSGTGWSESNSLVGDDQREFEEPSNILSNIVSGMAEVQRFMMASIEPLWDPVSEACISPEANSLNLKTLKILAGTEPELKKKGSTGAGRGKKAGCKGGKNQTKFNPSHPLFPQLALGCHMFDKPNFINPGPAHKKLYRHKTSTKFPRIDTMKGKRVERNPNKDIALMASFEKLRDKIWTH